MNLLHALARWLDIRPGEVRTLLLSFLGAFLALAHLVLARSLREALYLTSFDVRTLPYVTATAAVLALPTAYLFSRLLARHNSRFVLQVVLLSQAVGLGFLWPLLAFSRAAVVAFYLFTTLGALVMTCGYWLVITELFSLRSAKRLFGLIGAGGTAGAMVMGISLGWLTTIFEVHWLVLLLIVLLVLFYVAQTFLPRGDHGVEPEQEAGQESSTFGALRSLWENPHLRCVGLLVMTATMATTLIDYQFKEMLSAEFDTKAALTTIFGAFYGCTGAVSFVVQLLIAARLLKALGIGRTLSVLPVILLIGSVGFLVAPSLVLITLLRGADNSLRRSLHRSVLEVLFVPIPSQLRRQTKTFIDSGFDSVSEGVGAGIIFLWVTWADYPSVYLSVFVIGLTAAFLILNVIMNRQYFLTLLERIKEGNVMTGELSIDERIVGPDSLSESLTWERLPPELLQRLAEEQETRDGDVAKVREKEPNQSLRLEKIQSSDDTVVLQALDESHEWPPEHTPTLVRLLSRDSLYSRVIQVLVANSRHSLPFLVEILKDNDEDFVIRRRIPRVLSSIPDETAEDALFGALLANRFEIRYRAAIALRYRTKSGMEFTRPDWKERTWTAIRYELNRDKAVWELQRVLVDHSEEEDGLVRQNVKGRGELSLAHTFRMLALALEAEPVLMAFHGVLLDDEKLKGFALEYLELVLPADIRRKLWPFMGDISEHQREKSSRPLSDVISDVVTTGATLVAEFDAARLRKALGLEDD